MKIYQKKQFLRAKGYDVNGKDDKWVNTLFDIYHPQKKQPQPKGWKMWEATNRLHHYR
jgi:hypothetical protein